MKLTPVVTLTLLSATFLTLAPGCSGDDDDDSSAGDTTATPAEASPTPAAEAPQSKAVMTTLSSDYSVGALATVDLDSWDIVDSITTTSADPAVQVAGGLVFQINRYNYDSIRIYAPGSFAEPLVEFSTGDTTNPQDVAVCDDQLFVTLYNANHMGVYDLESGLLTGTVDLSAFDDGDGTPEASSMVQLNGKLYVGLQQLDEDNGWVPAGGTLAEVDCGTLEVTRSWSVGANPTVAPYPAAPNTVLIRTGVYFNADYSLALDGGISLFDVSTGTQSEAHLEESTLGANLESIVATEGGHALVTTSDASYLYTISCVDLSDWSVVVAETTSSSPSGVALNDRGEAWIAARVSWADPESVGGTIVYDVDSCTSLTEGDWLSTELPPNSIAFY